MPDEDQIPDTVAESLAAAATSGLDNLYFHVDWNQASIDSNTVTRDGGVPGEYVQWDPCEFLLMHGFNVVYVADGFDFAQIREAQKRAEALDNGRPTGIVYRTVKGWKYGIEGCKSHGAGHGFYSDEYLESLRPFEEKTGIRFPRYDGAKDPVHIEQAYYESLLAIRQAFENHMALTRQLGDWVVNAGQRLADAPRALRDAAPQLARLYADGAISPLERPADCRYKAGSKQTLRGALSQVLNEVNKLTELFTGQLADFINSQEIYEGEPLTEVQRAAFDMKADEDILVAKEYIEKAGNYQKAIDIYSTALLADPESEKLLAAIRAWAPPGPLQLAGGTNAHTAGLLSAGAGAAGVAFGGMARSLLRRPGAKPLGPYLAAHWDLLKLMPRLLSERLDRAVWQAYLREIGWPPASGAGEQATA